MKPGCPGSIHVRSFRSTWDLLLPPHVLVLRLQHARDRTLFSGYKLRRYDHRREIELVARLLPQGIAVRHIHWGGVNAIALCARGYDPHSRKPFSPFESPRQDRNRGKIDRDIYPRKCSCARQIGCTHAALAVQEFDEKVQSAIDRVQPISMIESHDGHCCANRVSEAVNFDLCMASHIRGGKHSKTRWSRRQNCPGPHRLVRLCARPVDGEEPENDARGGPADAADAL